MRAGRLRHRLVLQSQVEARGAAGGVSLTWSTEATVWGAIEPLNGREYLAARQNQNEATVRVVIRYNASIDETWRVVNGGRAYAIQAIINENDRNRELVLMCLQGVKEADSLPAEGDPANALYDTDGNPLTDVDGNYITTVD